MPGPASKSIRDQHAVIPPTFCSPGNVMHPLRSPRALLQPIVGYATAVALCLLILVGVLRLWQADLGIPLLYSDDSPRRDFIVVQMWTKATLDNGWYLHNDALGAPFGMDAHDYPMADHLHYLVMLVLGRCVSDHFAFVYNLYFLLGFPLTTLTALFVLSRFQVGWKPSVLCALLFTFLPYHFVRGPNHLMLASYYLIPLVVMVALWIGQGRRWWPGSAEQGKPWRWEMLGSLLV